ncbi:hypothetical protein A9Q74_04695 [Colwellia sp. 39_35_sub15_T18]|nr:hypothetical protein A9Q74_04695 [Colwellia sp. 39_35_sub15_T18]
MYIYLIASSIEYRVLATNVTPDFITIDDDIINDSSCHWWHSSSAEQFYLADTYILSSPEFTHNTKH